MQLNEPIIVLEDDIEILPNFFDALENIAKNRFEYVRLMQLNTGDVCQIDENFGVIKHWACGTQGYYLTPKGAQKFLRYAKSWVEPVDGHMDSYWKHHIPNVVYFPHPIRENSHALESMIADREAIESALIFKISRRVSKGCERLVKYFYDCFILKGHFSSKMR
ncbi:hypothetical protein BJI48_03870 [Helicobacter sp. 11S02596-1]|nr:hypothetical protein BJI48_03870 [Helicobacter sp. 11S02596-1]